MPAKTKGGAARSKRVAPKKKAPSRRVTELEARLSIQQERIDRLEGELQVSREVTRVTTGSSGLDEVLEVFMDVVLATMKSEAGSILMLDPRGQELSFKVVRGPKADDLKDMKVKLGEGIAGWVAKTGKPVLAQDPDKDHRFSPRISREINYQAEHLLCVPLKGKNETFGVLELLNRKDGRPYLPHDLQALDSLAAQISMVIDNARLFELAHKEIGRLSSLMEVSQVVNSTLDLPLLLRLVMESAKRTLSAEASSILLIDEKTGDLVFEVATGEKGDQMKLIRVPMGEGIAGWVAKEGRSLLVPDVTKDPRFYKKADEASKFITRSILAVPLRARGRVLGVVEVLNKIGGQPFGDEDTPLLEALAHQSAVAIENAKLYRDLQESFLSTVRSLAAAIDAKDSYTAGHASRVTAYSVAIAEELGLSLDEINTIRLSALMHDLGKIGIRESILCKPGRLTDEEFAEMRRHPEVGANILGQIPQLKHVVPGIRTHHERFDGKGYPDGTAGEAISLAGRIIGVADTFDAMTSDRVYRPRLTDEEAILELQRCSGGQFDGRMVEAFLRAYQKGRIQTLPGAAK